MEFENFRYQKNGNLNNWLFSAKVETGGPYRVSLSGPATSQ